MHASHHRHFSFGGERCGRRGGWRRSHPDLEEAMKGIFGIRRPLRFLAHKLDLDRNQTATLAAVLDDIKTERAQAAVDDRRTRKLFIEALSGDTFDAEKAKEAAAQRVESTRRVQEAIVGGLGKVHALLDEQQRERWIYLIQSGVLSF